MLKDFIKKQKVYIKNGEGLYMLGYTFGLKKNDPDDVYLKHLYRANIGRDLNLDAPLSFNEKIQWLKIHDRKPLYTCMVDKYSVKKYVSSIIGDEYIIPTIGVWNHFDEIDFDSLPNQFVLKCTHDSGGLVIVRDKNTLNKKVAKKKIEKCLKNNFYYIGREWPYKDVEPKIIAEQYMEEKQEGSFSDAESIPRGLVDYKFFCFGGIPQILYISKGLENHSTAEISFYDMEGKELPFQRSDYKPYHNAVLPDSFEEMKRIAQILAKNVNSPFVRIDLYSINNKIYFSEITFSPCSGMLPFEPIEVDYELGKRIILPIE